MEREYRQGILPTRLLLLSVYEVAHFLGVNSGTLRRWARQGLLDPYINRLRHNLRFEQEDIICFVHNRKANNEGG
ncbi:helix-turn-helix domain-containing protein [Chloroflexota bacterium]